MATACKVIVKLKKGLRILRAGARVAASGAGAGGQTAPVRLRSLLGGIGAQAGEPFHAGEWTCATPNAPTAAQRRDLEIAWRIVAAAQSNGIALVRNGQLLGLGSGQTSRVDAVHMALYKAGTASYGKDLDKLPTILKKGKIALLPPRGADRKTVKRIFSNLEKTRKKPT